MSESVEELRILKMKIIQMALDEIEKQQLLNQTQRVTVDNIVKNMIKEVTEYVDQDN